MHMLPTESDPKMSLLGSNLLSSALPSLLAMIASLSYGLLACGSIL